MKSRIEFQDIDVITILLQEKLINDYVKDESFTSYFPLDRLFDLMGCITGLQVYKRKRILIKLKRIFIEKNFAEENKFIYGNETKKTLIFDVDAINSTYNTRISSERIDTIQTRYISQSLKQTLYKCIADTDNKIATKILQRKVDKEYSIKSDRHFTINNKGLMTFTPKNRIVNIRDNQWAREGRMEIKIGKGLKRIFDDKVKLPNTFYEKMNNLIKSKYEFNAEIRLVSGYEIKHWYHYSNYSETDNTGTLADSCMKHEKCQDYFGIYTNNPDIVRMIIAVNNNNKLIGRAIVWRTNQGTFCDRIYGNDITIEKIKDYCKEKGILHKYKQTYSDERFVSSIGEILDDEIIVTLPNNSDEDLYPYMDTLKYTDDLNSGGAITLSSHNNYDITLDDIDGNNDDEEYIETENGYRIRRDDAVYIEGRGWYHSDDVTWSDYYSEYVITIDSTETYEGHIIVDDDDNFIYAEDTGRLHDGGTLTFSEYDSAYYYNASECMIHGYIQSEDRKILEVNDRIFYVHDDVSYSDLLENELITQEEYEMVS